MELSDYCWFISTYRDFPITRKVKITKEKSSSSIKTGSLIYGMANLPALDFGSALIQWTFEF